MKIKNWEKFNESYSENLIDIIRKEGKLINEYPVDELGNPNAGDAELWEYKNSTYEIITWNDRALEHEDGEETIVEKF